MIAFDFSTSQQIIFGAGSVRRLDSVLPQSRGFGLLVTGGRNDSTKLFQRLCPSRNFEVARFSEEPTIEKIQNILRDNSDFQWVVSIGGGSVIDGGKALAALVTNTGDVFDYLEVVGNGQALMNPPLPFIAIPTTSGSGAEATRNAVLRVTSQNLKVSLRSPSMLPRVAIVDPELTLALPPNLTASTGLDALTQVVEPFISQKANAMTDALCREAIPRLSKWLPVAFHDGSHLEARSEVAFGSLCGGMALANAGLGVVHGLAAPIGGKFNAPHGAVCAALLGPGLEINLRRATLEQNLGRFRELAILLTGNNSAEPKDALGKVKELVTRFKIPKLHAYGIGENDLTELCVKANNSSSMKGNPFPLTVEELKDVLSAAL